MISALDHVKRLHVVPVQVQRDTLPALRLLVDQGKRPARLLPRGKKVRGRLAHPAELALFGLMEIRTGRNPHGNLPSVEEPSG